MKKADAAIEDTIDESAESVTTTKETKLESKIYNVTSKEDGVTWGEWIKKALAACTIDTSMRRRQTFFWELEQFSHIFRNISGHISDTMRDMLIKYPTTKNIWCHLTNTTRYRIMEFFLVIFYHAIPGFLYDFVLQFTKNPRRLLPLYRKTHLFMV